MPNVIALTSHSHQSLKPVFQTWMTTRLASVTAIALFALAVCGTAHATLVAIYRNGLDTTAERTDVLKLSGRNCSREGNKGTLQIAVGKRTEECAYRTPVIGRNLEIAVTARLLPKTPRRVARKAFVGLVLRAGGGARYEFRVFPRQRKTQLVKLTGDGDEYLAIEKGVTAVKGVGRPNVLRLRTEGLKGKVKLSAFLGPTVVGEAVDDKGGIKGEFSALSVGAPRNGRGAIATFDAIVVRTPVRF